MTMPKAFRASLELDLRDRFDDFYGRMENDPDLERKGVGYADFSAQSHYGAFLAGYRARMDAEASSPLPQDDPT